MFRMTLFALLLASPLAAQTADPIRAEGVATLTLAADIRSSLLRLEARGCDFADRGAAVGPALAAETETLRGHIGVMMGAVEIEGLASVRSPRVAQEIEGMRARIAEVTPYFEAVTLQGGDPAYLAVVAEGRPRILRQAEFAYDALAQTFMHGRVDLFGSTTLATLARLTDGVTEMGRDACFGRIGLDEDGLRAATSRAAFEETLSLLEVGDEAARIAAPSEALASALACVRARIDGEDLSELAAATLHAQAVQRAELLAASAPAECPTAPALTN